MKSFLSSVSLATAIAATSFPAFADLVSPTGNLRIKHGSNCSTVNPVATYQGRNGASGILYALTCEGLGGDVYFDKFIDTRGAERCLGRLTTYYTSSSKGIVTRWQIDGTVPGYKCTTVGQTFEIERMRHTD